MIRFTSPSDPILLKPFLALDSEERNQLEDILSRAIVLAGGEELENLLAFRQKISDAYNRNTIVLGRES